MDIERYVRDSKRKVSHESKRIKDFRAFDFNYIPNKPIMRDGVKPIIDALMKYEKSNIPNNIAIFGSRGSGKTLIVKYLKNLLMKKTTLTIHYVNVRNYNTSLKIIAHILGKSARGTSLSEIYEEFDKKFKEKTVIILDEIDMFSKKDKGMDILYHLSRHSNNYMVIVLSNNPKILDSLDMPTKGTLQPHIISFNKYSPMQISEILRQRAKMGLNKNSYNKDMLLKIGAFTTKDCNSDVRVAIKTLYYNSTESGCTIEECFNRAQKDIYVDMITNENNKNILILRAIQTTRNNLAKVIYKDYLKLSSKYWGEPGISYPFFYNHLAYLQSIGLIILSSAKINRTYTNRVDILFDKKILDEVFKKRFID